MISFMPPIHIQAHLLDRPNAVLPRYQTDGAAGMDLRAAIELPIVIHPFGRATLPTGLVLAIPVGYEGQVRPRSGISLSKGLLVITGTIDSDYRGEIGIICINLNVREDFVVTPGMRLAQIVFAPVVRAQLESTPEGELSPTMRGINGFGSTGR